MSGIVGLSYANVCLEQEKENFVHDLFWETSFLQHLGQGYSGLATIQNKDSKKLILLRTHRGLFRQMFEKDLHGFIGPLVIGCVSSETREPYLVAKSAFPEFAIAFSGNIINSDEIISELVNQGHAFERTDDVVLISRLINIAGYSTERTLDENVLAALNYVYQKIKGSFTLVILMTEKIYAVRSPDGHKQLSLGQKQNAVVVSSELPSVDNQKFSFLREVDAGELISLENGEILTIGRIKIKSVVTAKPCIFDSVYYANPSSIILGTTAKEFREQTGACLARKHIAQDIIPDVIIPVPDSGRFHALGYYHEYVRQYLAGNINKLHELPIYDEFLIKYSFAGRSFTPDGEENRNIEGKKKIIPATEINIELQGKYAKKVLVVVDDSLVRGTQTKNDLMPKIRQLGFKEIHFCFAYAKIISPCPWGKSTKEYKELAAINEKNDIRTEKEIAKILEVKSCTFNTPEDLAKAANLSLNQFCCDCAMKI